MDTQSDNARGCTVAGASPAYLVLMGTLLAVVAGLAVAALIAHHVGTAVLASVFVVLPAIAILWPGRITVDQDGISHQNVFGRFRMHWKDVREIEYGAGAILLRGRGSRFVIHSPDMWSGPEKREAYTLMVRQIEATGILPIPNSAAACQWHSNVRIGR